MLSVDICSSIAEYHTFASILCTPHSTVKLNSLCKNLRPYGTIEIRLLLFLWYFVVKTG